MKNILLIVLTSTLLYGCKKTELEINHIAQNDLNTNLNMIIHTIETTKSSELSGKRQI